MLLWNNKIIDYKENKLSFSFNTKTLKKNLTLSESGIKNFSTITVISTGNKLGS